MSMFNVKVERLDKKPDADKGWISDNVTIWKLDEPIHSPFGEEVNYVLTSTVDDETALFAVDEEGSHEGFMFPGITAERDASEEAVLESVGLHAEA